MSRQQPPSQTPNATSPFFSPSAIHAMTTLTSASAPTNPSALPPIHPIFSASAFPSLPAPLYHLLTPTLHLATHLLLSPASLSWFAPVLLSQPTPVPADDARRARLPTLQYLPAVPATRGTIARVRELLAAHAGKVAFAFRDEDVHHAFASTHFVPATGTSLIYLNESYLAFLQGSYSRVGRGQRMRWGLHVATMLLHELAHSVNMVRFPNPPPPFGVVIARIEPLHSLEPGEVIAELGSSLERALFGGKIQPVGFDSRCAEGLMWYVWIGDKEIVREFFGVRMEWVEGVWMGEVQVGGRVAVVGETASVPFSEEKQMNRGG